MGNKLVSVILTTYKGSDVLERALLSIINQTYKNIEIIIIDDNGIDSKEQVETYKIVSKYKDVIYKAHKINSNGAVARNTGINMASGKYICFLDDDDEYTKERIKIQVAYLEKSSSKVGLCYCSFIEKSTNESKGKKVIAKKQKDLQRSLFLQKVRMGSSTIMIKRSVFCKVIGFDESFKRHQDWELLMRIFEDSDGIPMREIGLIKYCINRNHPFNSNLFEEYRLKYLEKYRDIINEKGKRKIMNFQYCEIGKSHYINGEKSKAKTYFNKCDNIFQRFFNKSKAILVKELRRND